MDKGTVLSSLARFIAENLGHALTVATRWETPWEIQLRLEETRDKQAAGSVVQLKGEPITETRTKGLTPPETDIGSPRRPSKENVPQSLRAGTPVTRVQSDPDVSRTLRPREELTGSFVSCVPKCRSSDPYKSSTQTWGKTTVKWKECLALAQRLTLRSELTMTREGLDGSNSLAAR